MKIELAAMGSKSPSSPPENESVVQARSLMGGPDEDEPRVSALQAECDSAPEVMRLLINFFCVATGLAYGNGLQMLVGNNP
ncbi:hypothetical protein TcWFU_005721 [Taenia crassiceps]|uniref:Uncharacterized protein n=1 Tax=Taenia crassiceps TaxID=6207 RepID=A0ABR4Q118_9CEST